MIFNGRNSSKTIKCYRDGGTPVQSMRIRSISHVEGSIKCPIPMTCMYSIQLASVSVRFRYPRNMESKREEDIPQSWWGTLSLSLGGIMEAT